jgi:hypothetical protein
MKEPGLLKTAFSLLCPSLITLSNFNKVDKKLLFAIALTWIFLAGCQTEIDLKLPDKEKKIVVQGLISPSDPVRIYVTESLSVTSKAEDIKIVNDAVVELWEDDQFVALLKYNAEAFVYEHNDIRPKVGSRYTIKVITQNHDPVIISSTVPRPVPVDAVKSAHKKLPKENLEFETTLDIAFQDRALEKNYYLIQVIYKDMNQPLSASNMYQTVYHSGKFQGIPLVDEGWDGQLFSLSCFFSWEPREDKDSWAQIRLYSLSEELYKYLKTLHMHRYSLSEPYVEPVPIFSNAINGIGLLGAYSYSAWDIKLGN